MFSNELRKSVISERLDCFVRHDLLESFSAERSYTNDIKDYTKDFSVDDRLLLVFLTSLFDNVNTGERMFHRFSGSGEFVALSEKVLREVIRRFLAMLKPDDFGDHSVLAHKLSNPIVLLNRVHDSISSYRLETTKSEGQALFFELQHIRSFRDIYNRISLVKGYHTRIRRFDYTEAFTKAFDFCTPPMELYLRESSGPARGISILLTGQRNYDKTDWKGDNLPIFERLISNIGTWSANVLGNHFEISSAYTIESNVHYLESWLLQEIEKRIDRNLLKDPEFMFAVESALCQIQKPERMSQYLI